MTGPSSAQEAGLPSKGMLSSRLKQFIAAIPHAREDRRQRAAIKNLRAAVMDRRLSRQEEAIATMLLSCNEIELMSIWVATNYYPHLADVNIIIGEIIEILDGLNGRFVPFQDIAIGSERTQRDLRLAVLRGSTLRVLEFDTIDWPNGTPVAGVALVEPMLDLHTANGKRFRNDSKRATGKDPSAGDPA